MNTQYYNRNILLKLVSIFLISLGLISMIYATGGSPTCWEEGNCYTIKDYKIDDKVCTTKDDSILEFSYKVKRNTVARKIPIASS